MTARIKKILISAAVFMMCAAPAKALGPIDILFNDTLISSSPAPFILNGHTMLPVRVLGEVFGCDEISWDSGQKKVTLKYGQTTAEMFIGSDTAYINGEETSLSSPPVIAEDKTYIGARFICEAFGAGVDWNERTRTVIITKDGLTVPEEYKENRYTPEDLEWLAKIVNAEAEAEPYDGKIAVANVVLNRVKSDEFPDTVYDVIFDSNYGIQFTPVAIGTIYNLPSFDSYSAAKEALFGKNVIGDCLYFCNPVTSKSSWVVNNRKFFRSIGGHDFFL